MEQTQYNEETQRALARVRKMMALANDAAASEGERDNALRMAHATLAKYNLSIADASNVTDDRGNKVLALRSPPWARSCAQAVAHLFFCEYYFVRVRGDQRIQHYFIGREANAVTAMEIAGYVIRSIQSESGKRRKELGQDGEWQTAFIKGAAHKVYYRCQDLRKQAEAESAMANTPKSTGTSLVLASVYQTELAANADWMRRQGITLRTRAQRTHSIKNYDGYTRGQEYGSTVSLNRQVGGKKAEQQGRLK